MDERLEKALAFSNYMVTFSNQKKIIKEKFYESRIYYENGFEFLATSDLLTFVSMLIQKGYTKKVPIVDTNDLPVIIEDLEKFFESLLDVYFKATNQYVIDYNKLIKNRSVEKINGL